MTTVQAAAYPKVGAALMAIDGGKVSSDATGTLRLSYGTVKGYVEDGKKVAPYTYISGLYERSAQHNNESPFDLTPSWAAAKSALNPNVAVRHGHHQRHRRRQQRIGDGGQEGRARGPGLRREPPDAGGYCTYYEASNRAISVDSRLILEALRKVYKADALVSEIAGAGKKK